MMPSSTRPTQSTASFHSYDNELICGHLNSMIMSQWNNEKPEYAYCEHAPHPSAYLFI